MLVTADQLVAHTIGDYCLQSDWMALEKTRDSVPAFLHALVYSLPFLWFSPSPQAMAIIICTHFVIDRLRLARFVVYAKNFLAPSETFDWEGKPTVNEGGGLSGTMIKTRWWHPWADCSATGSHKDRPAFLAVWLMIITDNAMHVLLNAAALKWF